MKKYKNRLEVNHVCRIFDDSFVDNLSGRTFYYGVCIIKEIDTFIVAASISTSDLREFSDWKDKQIENARIIGN